MQVCLPEYSSKNFLIYVDQFFRFQVHDSGTSRFNKFDIEYKEGSEKKCGIGIIDRTINANRIKDLHLY